MLSYHQIVILAGLSGGEIPDDFEERRITQDMLNDIAAIENKIRLQLSLEEIAPLEAENPYVVKVTCLITPQRYKR